MIEQKSNTGIELRPFCGGADLLLTCDCDVHEHDWAGLLRATTSRMFLLIAIEPNGDGKPVFRFRAISE